MNDPIVEFAKMFKDRENNVIDRWILGRVIKTSPIVVKCPNYELDSNELIKLQDTYNLNSTVVLMPSCDEQQYLILGEVK